MVLTNCPPGCTIVPTICLCTGRTRQRQAANGKIIPESPLILQQVRKLLRDDFARLNQSLQTALDGTGQALVQRLKQNTGMDQLEAAVVRASSSVEIDFFPLFLRLRCRPINRPIPRSPPKVADCVGRSPLPANAFASIATSSGGFGRVRADSKKWRSGSTLPPGATSFVARA